VSFSTPGDPPAVKSTRKSVSFQRPSAGAPPGNGELANWSSPFACKSLQRESIAMQPKEGEPEEEGQARNGQAASMEVTKKRTVRALGFPMRTAPRQR